MSIHVYSQSYSHLHIKIVSFFVFSADESKIIKCIWKILFSSFKKCYGLLGSELPLARCLLVDSAGFFIFLSSVFHERQLQGLFIILFLIFQVHSNILLRLLLFFTTQKIGHFWHFNDQKAGSNYDNSTNNPIFLIYFLSSIHWYVSFLHFKTFKFHFHGVPLLH